MGCRIIAVDDEQDFLDSLRRALIPAGYTSIHLETDPARAAKLFVNGEHFDLALLDVTMPGMNGTELLQIIRNCSPGTECIMISALNEARTAIETIREGAYDYLVKPISREELLLKVRHALDRKRLLRTLELNQSGLSPALAHPEAFSHIKTASPAMMRLLKEAELHAASDVPVLITGESGTGKELLAKAIHLASPRVSSTFTPVNMASLSSNFMDSDFFGHTRGAFTGAEKERAGYLESTDGGTLFLDEIGNLPLELQGKLLRVIQEGEFTKIGTNRLKRIDIRFIAATNEDMEKLTARGLFRKDLYYRLKGAWLHLPPLRKRKEDIPILAAKFLEDLSERAGEARIDEEALSALVNYDFPGNIRELKSIVTASLNIARGGTITPNCLPGHLKARKAASKQESIFCPHRELTIADVERVHILNTYRMTGGNKAKTAKILGTGLNTLRRKLESYGEK